MDRIKSDVNNKTNTDQLLPEFVSPPNAPSKKPATPKLFKSPHPIRFSPTRRSPVQTAASKNRNSPKGRTASGSQQISGASALSRTVKSNLHMISPTTNTVAPSPSSNVTARKYFNSPTKRSSKSTGSENLTPKIVVSPPTPTSRFSSGPLHAVNGGESKPPRSLSSERSHSPTPILELGRGKSVDDLTRKSELIQLTARRRSSAVQNGLVKKEFSNYSVQIGIRIRPFITKRHSLPATAKVTPELIEYAVKNDQPGVVVVKNGDQTLTFNFENVFSDVTNTNFEPASGHGLAKQEKVYMEMARPLVEALVDGYNCCFLAYGQTGSGKTYSTMGPVDCPGIVPRFCRDLFDLLEKNAKANSWLLEVGYYEIYNEKIRDLLITDAEHHSQLKIREHPETGPFIDGLGCFPVRTYHMIQTWMDFGNRQRATSATFKNDQSSRSHAIFMLKLTQKETELVEGSQKEYTRTSSAYLVDLAGSERACTSFDLKETSSINKSLSCLGKVILQLAEKKQQYINYRDSILTWLLKEYLGGNAKTSMLVTVSPSEADVEETISTLRYAHQARAIVNRVCINEDPAITALKKYKQEIDALKKQLDMANGVSISSTDKNPEDIIALRQEITLLTEKLKETENKRLKDNEAFEVRLTKAREAGYQATKTSTSRLPFVDSISIVPGRLYIALLSGDALVSHPTLFDFQENDHLVVGSEETCNIRLESCTVPSNVCSISFNGQYAVVIRRNDGIGVKLCVNGEDIANTKILADGDYLNICGEYFLRIWIPVTPRDSLVNAVEYEKAKSQLLFVQNIKLRDALARRSRELKDEQEMYLERIKCEKDLEIERMQKDYEEKIANLEQLLLEEKSAATSKSTMESIKSRRDSLLYEITEAKQEFDEAMMFRSELLIEIENLSKKCIAQPHSNSRRVSRRSSLLSVELLVDEANMLLRDWRKQFEFSYEEGFNGDSRSNDTMIRLTNTKLFISTLLTVPDFRQRVELLRSLYESGHITAPKLEKVLMNANDKWESINGPDSSLYPIAVINSLKKAKRRSSFAMNGRRRSSMSPKNMRQNSFVLNYTFGVNNVLDQIAERPQADGLKLIAACFQNACSNEKCFYVETVIDSAVDNCNTALLSIKALNEDESLDSAVNFGLTLLRCYWSFMMCGLWDFMAVEDLNIIKDEFVDRVDATNTTIRLIFRTMDVDMVDVKHALCQRLKDNLIDLCQSFGSATFLWPTKPVVHCLNACRKCQIEPELLASFVKGFCHGYTVKREQVLNKLLHLENGRLASNNVKVYRIVGDCLKSLDSSLPMLQRENAFKNRDDLANFCCNILYGFVHGLAAFGSKRDPTFITNLINNTRCLANENEIAECTKDFLSKFIENLSVLETVLC